jgi:hypothetical protein
MHGAVRPEGLMAAQKGEGEAAARPLGRGRLEPPLADQLARVRDRDPEPVLGRRGERTEGGAVVGNRERHGPVVRRRTAIRHRRGPRRTPAGPEVDRKGALGRRAQPQAGAPFAHRPDGDHRGSRPGVGWSSRPAPRALGAWGRVRAGSAGGAGADLPP